MESVDCPLYPVRKRLPVQLNRHLPADYESSRLIEKFFYRDVCERFQTQFQWHSQLHSRIQNALPDTPGGFPDLDG